LQHSGSDTWPPHSRSFRIVAPTYSYKGIVIVIVIAIVIIIVIVIIIIISSSKIFLLGTQFSSGNSAGFYPIFSSLNFVTFFSLQSKIVRPTSKSPSLKDQ
jgi:hypothetical protein